ncbi:hypothetical protein [Burkholderia pseudomallei]|uniref:hypothetical protein n=1 Tax=Burkholderia pseudomallei TaxID=28450 RepID=UPI001FCA9197|nr:hypothetical protein [Burkholderia pseudomallei]
MNDQQQSRADALTGINQFLMDVVTAAGLLSHGRTDKKLATRITDQAYELRKRMYFLAASPVEQPALLTAQDALAAIETFEIVGDNNDSREPNAEDRFILTEFVAHLFGGFRVELPAAAPADGACKRCGSTTAQACNDAGCFYLESGDGEPSAAPADERTASFEAWCDRFPEISAVERLRDAWQEARAAASPAAEAVTITDAEAEMLVGIKKFHTHDFGRGPELHADAITDAYKRGRAAAPQPPAQADARAGLTEAARDVLAERRRQVEQEGWTPAHDDEHDKCEMALAAIVYTESAVGYPPSCPDTWPWSPKWFKPTTPRRDLVKAAALVIAEIERLDRAATRTGASS